jgi:hypothetical protein
MTALVSLFGCSPMLNAGENDNGGKLKLTETSIESSFSVANQTITPKKADLEICKSDNDYMLSAFKEKGIEIKSINYDVVVSKKTYMTSTEKENGELTLFHYEVELQDFSVVMQQKFPVLAKEKYITTYIPLSEAPTTCYAFAGKDKLNLLCHFGMKQYKSVPDIIESLK